jgi:hypothetical protein
VRLKSEDTYPNLDDLSNFPKLSHLSVCTAGDFMLDFSDVEAISQLRNLRYLHFANDIGEWPDLESLGHLNSLEEIELSTVNLCTDSVLGLDYLEGIKLITINIDKRTTYLPKLLKSIEIFLPDCEIKVQTGWNLSKW